MNESELLAAIAAPIIVFNVCLMIWPYLRVRHMMAIIACELVSFVIGAFWIVPERIQEYNSEQLGMKTRCASNGTRLYLDANGTIACWMNRGVYRTFPDRRRDVTVDACVALVFICAYAVIGLIVKYSINREFRLNTSIQADQRIQADRIRRPLSYTSVTAPPTATCSVCLEHPTDAVELDCSHVFCRTCIGRWNESKRNCPNCRVIVRLRPPDVLIRIES